MVVFPFHALLQRLLVVTAALPLGLLAEGAAPAHAVVVILTGANGGTPGGAAPPADADAGHLIPNSDPSNTAKATGGNGGAGTNAIIFCLFECHPPPAQAGGAGGDATATAMTSISSTTTAATATATSFGGAGGAGGTNKWRSTHTYIYPGGVGGAGGTGDSSATVLNTKGSAAATATATGGTGGGGGFPGGSGGAGGGASASSSATGGGAGTVLSQATAYGGGAGGARGIATANAYGQSTGSGAVDVAAAATGGAGGAASPATAYATGVALTGNVQANASANGGNALVPGTAAFAQSEAKNSKGEALTTASAPGDAGGIPPSAVTSAGVGPGSNIPITLNSSQVVSDAILTPNGLTNSQTIGEGEMSAAFSGGLLLQTYAATAVFDFTSASEALDLTMLSDKAVGIGFDSLELQVKNRVRSTTLLSETFSSVTSFFNAGNSIPLGEILGGNQSIEIDFSLSYWNTTSITPNASFGFTYALVDPPLAATPLSAAIIPEPSTWAMMLIGFAGAGFAGYRASRKTAALAA